MVGRTALPSVPTHLLNGGDDDAFRPPPSTIAAQLVRNHAENTKGPRQSNDSATFRQLLQEILGDKSTPEKDAEVNHKLIHVVVEAGLDVLFHDNPFAQWDVLLPQAIESLAVVDATIARQPDILTFEECHAEQAQIQPNMLAWLFPKILSLACHPKGESLQQGLQSLLRCLVISLSKTLDLWQYSQAMLEIIKDCVLELTLSMERGHHPSSLTIVDTALPPTRSLGHLCKGVDTAVTIPAGYQMHVKDSIAALKTVLILLSAVVDIVGADKLAQRLKLVPAALLAWVLDVTASASLAHLKLRQYLQAQDQFDHSSMQTLQLHRRALKDLETIHTASGDMSSYEYVRFAECCSSYVVAACEHQFSSEAQCEVGKGLEYLLTIASKHPEVNLEQVLLPACQAFVADETRFATSLSDIARPISTAVSRWSSDVPRWVLDKSGRSHTPHSNETPMPDLEGDTSMIDEAVAELSKGKSIKSTRRRKLRAIFSYQPEDVTRPKSVYETFISRLARLLGELSGTSIIGLSRVALQRYGTLSDTNRSQMLRILAVCPCAATESLIDDRCQLCHNDRRSPSSIPSWNEGSRKDDWNEVSATLRHLQDCEELQASSKHRTLITLAIRSFVMHTTEQSALDLGRSFLAAWCLRCLHSSSRELRIAAGRALVAFLRTDLPQDLRDNNRRLALDFLRALSAREGNCHHETLILTWGQIARTCGESELNLALLRLVEYLGHSNSVVCALAFSELEGIAEYLSLSPKALLGRYYHSIAVSVVQDQLTKPQKIQQLVELLEMNINTFLILTQLETIPYLVLTHKKDVLQRIASARHPKTSIQDLILSPPKNLAAVISFLLVQPSSDVEQSTWSHLTEVAPGLQKSTELANLIKLDPVLIACEMLKAAGDEDEANVTKAYHAVQQFTVIAEGRQGQPKSGGRSGRIMASFFEAHVLGIMTAFSNMIEETSLLLSEKVRCIRAIEQMIRLAQTNVVIGLPQVRACLQYAATQDGLQDAALSAWVALIAILDGADVVDLVDETFAMVVQHWSQLSSAIQQTVYDSIGEMLKSHSNLIREKVITIPSLASIPLMSKFESEIQRLKEHELAETHLRAFVRRLLDDNVAIVRQALEELVPWLEIKQSFMHEATVSEQPKAVIADISRALLDVCTKHAAHSQDIVGLSAQCMGIIGCLDPNRVDAPSIKRQTLVLDNFDKASEVIDWVAIMLEDVIVPAFKSGTNTRAQGFLAYVMQELVRFCEFNEVASVRLRASQASPAYLRWMDMPESVRNTLMPFLSSRYVLNSRVDVEPRPLTYPVFSRDSTHRTWLQTWVYDMMWRAKGENPKMVFPVIARICRGPDLSVSRFLLPYAAVNIIIGGTDKEAKDIADELLMVLSTESNVESEKEILRRCSEDVFAVLDYMSKWLQEKKRSIAATRTTAVRAGHSETDFEEEKYQGQINSVEKVIQSIPANIIAQRAIECGSYARALYHWEQFMREQREGAAAGSKNSDVLYQRLHSIYSEIDEPDGLDGISTHLNILSPEQQAFQQRRAGRWSAAQSWYQMELRKAPTDRGLQVQFLSCLREAGQFDQVLQYASSYHDLVPSPEEASQTSLLPIIAEASWSMGRLDRIEAELTRFPMDSSGDFNIGVAKVLLAMKAQKADVATAALKDLRDTVAKNLTTANTTSLSSCHDVLLRLHTIYEIEALSGMKRKPADDTQTTALLSTMEKRLAVVGSYTADKQYLLGVRRAVMELSGINFNKADIGSSWLTTARLARKGNISSTAHHAVLMAFECGDNTANIELARLLWRDGQHRQAIQSLEGAIASDVFASFHRQTADPSEPAQSKDQNMQSARAQLLLAKWLDASGQTSAAKVTTKFQYAAKTYSRWEKGHYYLGKHYNKLMEAEKALPAGKQSEAFTSGEMTKLVIENYLRSVPFGSKYWYQTIPKIITLWLDLGTDCMSSKGRVDADLIDRRNRFLDAVHRQMKKYFERIPPYIIYNALPQMISRISHPNLKVWEVLSMIITKVVSTHPSQALWSLLAVIKSSDPNRAVRGASIINKLKDPNSRLKSDTPGIDLRTMITQGTRLSDALLQACDIHIETRSSNVSLAKDLGFNHKLAPSSLVIPLESTLIANTPAVPDAQYIRKFVAFAQDKVTIVSFSDDVLVLSSLQRPRKLTVRGSDGKLYGLLCKPKDDLRKDQRLMEFNTMINRALKRDAEASKRRLYIKTYGVTPLSEESGTIEWVEGIKPLRDILLKLYERKGVRPNYNQLRVLLAEAAQTHDNVSIFNDQVLKIFPPVLHEWFTQTFPEPDSWFAARIRYARSAAVMSMVGHVLGLGDRHGENILLQEGTGGVFHVDFNCLFDKGLTFEKPELVPFRLTHNMVDAMGAYGYEGPFRKSAELTLGLLRQHQDTLMNILETFVYDPTTDFVGKKKRTTPGVPDTPKEVLDSIASKLRGLLRGESVPLSVEGHVDALILQAVDSWNLCQMYIGWCAFL